MVFLKKILYLDACKCFLVFDTVFDINGVKLFCKMIFVKYDFLRWLLDVAFSGTHHFRRKPTKQYYHSV